MTEVELLVLTGFIWVAPHCDKIYSLSMGCICLIVGVCKALGWI